MFPPITPPFRDLLKAPSVDYLVVVIADSRGYLLAQGSQAITWAATSHDLIRA